MKNTFVKMFAASAMTLALTACGSSSAAATATAAPAAAPEATAEAAEAAAAGIVGSWKLDKVLLSEKEGEAPAEITEEGHASMFGEKDNTYTFNEDGTAVITQVAGPDTTDVEGTWTAASDTEYTVKYDSTEETYVYDKDADTLTRTFTEKDPYMELQTVFARQ